MYLYGRRVLCLINVYFRSRFQDLQELEFQRKTGREGTWHLPSSGRTSIAIAEVPCSSSTSCCGLVSQGEISSTLRLCAEFWELCIEIFFLNFGGSSRSSWRSDSGWSIFAGRRRWSEGKIMCWPWSFWDAFGRDVRPSVAVVRWKIWGCDSDLVCGIKICVVEARAE